MTAQLRSWTLQAACALALAVLPQGGEAAPNAVPELAPPARLRAVTVTDQKDSTIVRIKTVGPAKYRADFLENPYRLVVDLEDTIYGWRKLPLSIGGDPVKQVRGSQYRQGIARVVVEFTRRVGYAIRDDDDGLAIIVPMASAAGRRGATPPAVVGASASAAPAMAAANLPIPATAPTPAPLGAIHEKTSPASQGAETGKAPVAEPPAPATAVPAKAPANEPARAQRPASTPGPRAERAPVRVAQATTPAPSERLISLEFKDADVVNLLRILAAESGRNIVIGDDVKGKMSISLRNVPWQLALDTVLEARGLERVEKDGVMRIVSREQLTKEREARARVEEARIKGEAEARAKLAEAQVKEAEAVTKKIQADVARQEQEARGPLREETIRLSYADPEEVAKTLQGILGIPAEGAKITGPGFLGVPGGPPNPELQPLGGPAGPQTTVTTGPVSVSQDVLAKGLTIRAHKPTNTIFLRLYQADLERVKKLIRESLDIPLPQVKIEARMEILDRSALEQIGIQWGGFYAATAGNSTLVGQGLQTTTAGGQTIPLLPGRREGTTDILDLTPVVGPVLRGTNPNPFLFIPPAGATGIPGQMPISFQTGLPLGGNLVNLPISALPNAGPLPAAGLSFGIVGTRWNVNLALQALASQGKTRTLARPEVVTVENSKATMSLGEEIPYATISSAGTQIQFKEALLKLEVTPTVIRENGVTKIKLIVIVENNSRGDVVNLGNAGAPPAINRRKAETQVLIREGERLIIGGVTTSVSSNTTRKVPILGDIPLLGYLFKQRENFETGRELVVFLTPSVLKTVEKATAASAAPAPK